jgi:hypothetical protein
MTDVMETRDPWESLISQGSLVVQAALSGVDRTAIELFIAGVRGWEVGLRRHVEGS